MTDRIDGRVSRPREMRAESGPGRSLPSRWGGSRIAARNGLETPALCNCVEGMNARGTDHGH